MLVKLYYKLYFLKIDKKKKKFFNKMDSVEKYNFLIHQTLLSPSLFYIEYLEENKNYEKKKVIKI